MRVTGYFYLLVGKFHNLVCSPHSQIMTLLTVLRFRLRDVLNQLAAQVNLIEIFLYPTSTPTLSAILLQAIEPSDFVSLAKQHHIELENQTRR